MSERKIITEEAEWFLLRKHFCYINISVTAAFLKPCCVINCWYLIAFLSFPLSETITTHSITYLLTYIFTYLLHVARLNGSKLVKKLSTFYWTRRFITAFTNACNVSLSRAIFIQSIWKNNLNISSHLPLGLPGGLFPSCFPNLTLYTLLFFPVSATCSALSNFSIWSPKQYWMNSTDH